MRGISLDEIAVATKIGTRSLKALEDENFSILPGGIFNKGFVRSYAKFLGLNEDEAVADYQAAVKEQPVSVKTIAAQSAMAKANRLAAQQARESARTAGVVRAVVLLLLSIGVAYGGYRTYKGGYLSVLKLPRWHWRSQQPKAPAPAAPEATSVVETGAQPAATPPAENPANQTAPDNSTPATAAPTPPSVTPEPVAESPRAVSAAPEAVAPRTAAVRVPPEFTVSIKTTERSWLSITTDGKRPFRKTFARNEHQEITAKSRVRIVLGNPIATELSLNGKPLAIDGDLSHPRIVVVDATGLASE